MMDIQRNSQGLATLRPSPAALAIRLASVTTMCCLALVSAGPAAGQAESAIGRSSEAVLQSYCVKCHSSDKAEGQVRLDNLPLDISTVETADRWQKVLNALNSGEMPPKDEPQPDERAKAELLSELSNALVQARKSIGDQGRIGVLRRLNRREYLNTIRDLLGVETEAEGLPDDMGAGVYDTVGAALYLSSDQLERYLEVGRSAVSIAVSKAKLARNPPPRKTERRETEFDYHKFHSGTIRSHLEVMNRIKKWQLAGSKADALPKGFNAVQEIEYTLKNGPRGYNFASTCLALPKATQGSYLIHAGYNLGNEPVPIPANAPQGKYIIRLRTATADEPHISRFIELVYLEEGDRHRPKVVDVRDVNGSLSSPEEIEFAVQVTASSPRHYVIREKRYSNNAADHFKYNQQIDNGNGIGTIPAIWIDWIEWDGPVPEPEAVHRSAELFGSSDSNVDEPAAARHLLETFATGAFRGVQPKPSFIDRLVAVQQQRRHAGDDFLDSLVEPMAIVLAAPRFLFLNEPLVAAPGADSSDASVGRQLSDLERASRLSYFLWSAPPDQQLIDLANSGDLRKPKELAAQVDRMVADPRSFEFASGFTHQWLQVDRLDLFPFDYKNFPKFDESTRRSARQEVYRTFHTLLTEDLDARRLLKSDFVVIDSVMADYYGISTDDQGCPVIGMHFRKVPVPGSSPRGGLLGMACILGMGSDGAISSPVERGAWVLRKLLHAPPPPAPANVPQLSRLNDQKVTARERLIAHQERAQCAQCHRRIDPIGFGLENVDAAGQWRDVDTFTPGEWLRRNADGTLMVKTYAIDPAGAFWNGPEFHDFFELRNLIAARDDDFLRGLIENLYEYALGRPISFADAEVIDGLVRSAKENGGGLRSIVKDLVATEEFQTR